jgi:hypothetical protein
MKHDEIYICAVELNYHPMECNSNLFLSFVVFHSPKNALFTIRY